MTILGFIVVYVIIGIITNLLVVLVTGDKDTNNFMPIGLGWPLVLVFGGLMLITYALFEYIPTKIIEFIEGQRL